MNKLHSVHSLEVQYEDRLQDLLNAPTEPELAADWLLRNELTQLGPEQLPLDLRHRILRQTRRVPLRWAGGMAMAASIAAMLLVSHWIQQPEDDITRADAENFELAMQTISTASELALGITGRELNEHLRMPAINLERLPYSAVLQSMIVGEAASEINDVEVN